MFPSVARLGQNGEATGASPTMGPSLRFAREIVMNPIGANLWIWDSPVTDDVIWRRAPLIAAMGFDLVELPLEHPDDWNPSLVKPILDD
ncbi:MAG: hypothetical protein AVDCRST_MAG87-2061, partial [uncultured Thermomicrobiales bacterium]